MQKNTILIAVIVAILGAGGGFFAGMQYQKSQRPSFAQFAGAQEANGGFNRRFGNGQARVRGGAVIGEILSSDDKSITVKLPDGSSKIVLVAGTTTINKAATATKEDLKTGERVAVFGTTNSDGSVTAQNVQLNPTMRMQSFGGQPQPSGTQ